MLAQILFFCCSNTFFMLVSIQICFFFAMKTDCITHVYVCHFMFFKQMGVNHEQSGKFCRRSVHAQGCNQEMLFGARRRYHGVIGGKGKITCGLGAVLAMFMSPVQTGLWHRPLFQLWSPIRSSLEQLIRPALQIS